LAEDTDPAVREAVAGSIGRIDGGTSTVALLQRLLADATTGVRLAAAGALADIGRPACAAAADLLRRQDDPDPRVREAATLALMRIINPDSMPSDPPCEDARRLTAGADHDR
jgi:HEAT repeat protein